MFACTSICFNANRELPIYAVCTHSHDRDDWFLEISVNSMTNFFFILCLKQLAILQCLLDFLKACSAWAAVWKSPLMVTKLTHIIWLLPQISVGLSNSLRNEADVEKYKDLRALLQLLSNLCSKDMVTPLSVIQVKRLLSSLSPSKLPLTTAPKLFVSTHYHPLLWRNV